MGSLWRTALHGLSGRHGRIWRFPGRGKPDPEVGRTHTRKTRKARRFEGDYMLRQQDIVDQVEHDDGVAYGALAIDLHPADGVFSEFEVPTLFPAGVYRLSPYRCLISRNIPNLFFAGRLSDLTCRLRLDSPNGNGRAHGPGCRYSSSHVRSPGTDAAAAIRHCVMRNSAENCCGLASTSRACALTSVLLIWWRVEYFSSSEFVLEELPADGGCIKLDKSRAQVLPAPPGRLPASPSPSTR